MPDETIRKVGRPLAIQTATAGLVRSWAEAAAHLADGFADYAVKKAMQVDASADDCADPGVSEMNAEARVRQYMNDANRIREISSWLQRIAEGTAGVHLTSFDGMTIGYYQSTDKEA